MRSLIVFTCLLGISLQAPSPQTGPPEPPSIEILLPYGFHGADVRGLHLPGVVNAAAGQYPGHASIEYVVPIGGHAPQNINHLPAHLRHYMSQLSAQGYIKQKKLDRTGRESHEVRNAGAPAQSVPQQTPAKPASYEVVLPYGYQGQHFQPQLLMDALHKPINTMGSPNQGHVSIEMLFPHTPQRHGSRSPQHLETGPLSQGYIKQEIPQPPGAPSVEVIYPLGYSPQNHEMHAAEPVPRQACHNNPAKK